MHTSDGYDDYEDYLDWLYSQPREDDLPKQAWDVILMNAILMVGLPLFCTCLVIGYALLIYFNYKVFT